MTLLNDLLTPKDINTTCTDMFKVEFEKKVFHLLKHDFARLVNVYCENKEEVNSMLYLYIHHGLFKVSKFNVVKNNIGYIVELKK